MNPILYPGRNCSGIYEVRQTGLLVDGADYFRAVGLAASLARRYILFTGWQFDSHVRLIRGEEATTENGDILFLPHLQALCRAKPGLRVYILAWDYTVMYGLDREWFQEWIFSWEYQGQIDFRFDRSHPVGACHHQKLAVIDGIIGFVGGMDIASTRWDDRRHLLNNPLRTDTPGQHYEPVHDIQSYLVGPAAAYLAEYFNRRWVRSGGDRLNLDPVDDEPRFSVTGQLPLGARSVAVSRTEPTLIYPEQNPVYEIKALYGDAINAAEQLIYMENQYFSSQSVYEALIRRMSHRERSRLQVAIILPERSHAITEEIAHGVAQTRILASLRELAIREGHSLGIYFTRSQTDDVRQVSTYIHSKLILVDDRFLSVGSANTTNRSMGLDTEMNVSWEAASEDDRKTIRSIRIIRQSLLLEHTGVRSWAKRRRLAYPRRLVDFLDSLAEAKGFRLEKYEPKLTFGVTRFLADVKMDSLMDPEKPVIEENLIELTSGGAQGVSVPIEAKEARRMSGLRKVLTVLVKHKRLVLLLVALFVIGLLVWQAQPR